jgi:hypothetical protein
MAWPPLLSELCGLKHAQPDLPGAIVLWLILAPSLGSLSTMSISISSAVVSADLAQMTTVLLFSDSDMSLYCDVSLKCISTHRWSLNVSEVELMT